MDAESIIKKLGLVPHQGEGGYFVETYRSRDVVPAEALPRCYSKAKACSTAIYYLLTPDTCSAMHRLCSDEVFHFYSGDPVEMLRLYPDGSHEVIALGSELDADETPQVIVPKSTWQGCRLKPGGEYALLGTTVAPAFDYEDFELGDREKLVAEYPDCAETIRLLTR